ncbi:P-loop containing nucleoside triphosphate hydrolase protein [Auricularia subglabra TFB-10046 SS5]|nr:P-loop containing nucleoside triphosphate hydrolase protein [Auricularia subglabra TFB-10046 SS5]
MCNVHVKADKWWRHAKAPRHKRKADFAVYRAALVDAEKNRDGVSVQPETIDYGVVEVASLSRTPDVLQTFRITSESSSGALLERVQFHSALQKSRKRPYVPSFSVEPQVANHRVVARSPLLVTVKFSPRGRRGRYQDRLQITFQEVQTGKSFSIVRDVTAVVTDGEDFRMLQPTAPYRPREKMPVVEDPKIVSAPSARTDVPWTRQLPVALIPLPLKKTLREIENRAADEQRHILVSRKLVPEGPLSQAVYKRLFKALLSIEEDRLSADLHQFDMQAQELKKVGVCYTLAVPGLSEGRPSIIKGDRIIVRSVDRTDKGKWFEGRVSNIFLNNVELHFAPPFHEEWDRAVRFDVRFRLNTIPLQRMHQALGMEDEPSRLLFPGLDDIASVPPRASTVAEALRLKPANRRISGNPAQREAVVSILNLPAGSAPFVVFGPPGTGKTVTIVEAIRQLTLRDPSARIFACAPSNPAADLIAERLVGEGLNPQQLFRLNAPSRAKAELPKRLEPFSLLKRETFVIPSAQILASYTVVVSTCISAAVPYGIDPLEPGLFHGHFSHIFVDEVGQAVEPEVLIAVRTMGDKSTRLIVSGDPKQLGPIVHSPIAENMESRSSGRHLGLGWSYLDRLMEQDAYAEMWRGVSWVKLLKNWRSHESILKFPNEAFYENELEACADPVVTRSLLRFHMLPKADFPVVFHGIVGKDEREAQSPSYFNRDEASLVKTYVTELLGDKRLRLKESDIGIIAPYHAQCTKIQQLLKKYTNIKVGSVEKFQGQERRVIIISAVRSNPDLVVSDVRQGLGFVKNPRRFNVAVTRAQALLIAIGNPDTLVADENWMRFMSYIHRNGGWTGVEPDWDTRAPSDGTSWGQGLEQALAEVDERQQIARAQTLNALRSQIDADEIAGASQTDERGANATWRDAI